jgi:urease accessory protein
MSSSGKHYPTAGTPPRGGRLHLHFMRSQGQDVQLRIRDQHPPLQVVRAFPLPGGGALVHVHNLSGGVLGGDQLALDVEVGEEAHVQLTSTGATRLYRSRPESPPAVQTNTIKVREGALLEYLPDPIIPFSGSRYQQRTRIDLEVGAGLFWWETVAPGRAARGELFDYEHLLLDLSISAQGRPIAIERLKLEPHRRALSSPARLGCYSHFSSFYVLQVGLESVRWTDLEKELGALAQDLSRPGELSWGVSALVAHGLIIRAVSSQGRDIPSGLLAFWRVAKRYLYEEEPILPRKMY